MIKRPSCLYSRLYLSYFPSVRPEIYSFFPSFIGLLVDFGLIALVAGRCYNGGREAMNALFIQSDFARRSSLLERYSVLASLVGAAGFAFGASHDTRI